MNHSTHNVKRDRSIGESKTYALKVEIDDLALANRIARIMQTTTANIIRSAIRNYLERVESYVDEVEATMDRGTEDIRKTLDRMEDAKKEINPDGLRTDKEERMDTLSHLRSMRGGDAIPE